MDNTNTTIPIRISVSEASRIFGVSTKTIREAIKNNEVRYIVVNGRYKINFESLLLWSQKSTRRKNLLSTAGIGQYVDHWKITNKKYSPNAELIEKLKNQIK
ncbi:MAG: helix-turn-helix domain-containing protein [Candidatus Komeilibacteria bacterium]|nr:helix-turn-helix domain-containing protein [Candidatus Komeilibacteria bacterium]